MQFSRKFWQKKIGEGVNSAPKLRQFLVLVYLVFSKIGIFLKIRQRKKIGVQSNVVKKCSKSDLIAKNEKITKEKLFTDLPQRLHWSQRRLLQSPAVYSSTYFASYHFASYHHNSAIVRDLHRTSRVRGSFSVQRSAGTEQHQFQFGNIFEHPAQKMNK